MPSDRAAFLDRDGTIIEDAHYLGDPDAIIFTPGAFEALKLLRAADFRIIIVTNQSGIARGLYSLEQYRAVESRLNERLAGEGIRPDAVFFCPHHPDYTGPCECRKPGLGMYREAARNFGIDLAASVYIGDRVRDVLPALALGGHGILIETAGTASPEEPVPGGVDLVPDLLAAARLAVGKTRAAP